MARSHSKDPKRLPGWLGLLWLLCACVVAEAQDITSNLLVYYNMEEGTGTNVSDSMGNDTQCTLNSAGWATGKIGSWATSYNGARRCEGEISADSNLGLAGTTQLTVAVWVKPANFTTEQCVTLKAHGGGGYYMYRILIQTNGQFRCDLGKDGGSTPFWRTTGTLTAGVWNHIACAWKRTAGVQSDMVVYINGTVTSTTFTTNAYDNTFTLDDGEYPLLLGSRDATNSYSLPYTGDIDEFRLYGRQLTQTDIQTLPGNTVTTAPTRRRMIISQAEGD